MKEPYNIIKALESRRGDSVSKPMGPTTSVSVDTNMTESPYFGHNQIWTMEARFGANIKTTCEDSSHPLEQLRKAIANELTRDIKDDLVELLLASYEFGSESLTKLIDDMIQRLRP